MAKMSDKTRKGLKSRTRAVIAGREPEEQFGFVNTPIYRGSTVLYPDVATLKGPRPRFSYGTKGTPTTEALEKAWTEIAGAAGTVLAPTGLAAISLALMTALKAGDHLLVTDSAYQPTRTFCNSVLKRMGVETEYYDPLIGGEITRLFRPNTTTILVEAPGSQSFEMQDVPAIARAAHAAGCVVMMDNTWGIHHFMPFQHGVDVSIQALTKYVGGHSDVLLGSITVNSEKDYEIVRGAASQMGHFAAPDDCWLALRGARTMPIRLKQQEKSGLEVAHWFENRPEVQSVLHPALPSHPQHALWKRDFTGACSLFGVVFKPHYTEADIFKFIDSLKLFGIGASWGGFESLALPTTGFITRTATSPDLGGFTVRIHIGLEDVGDLIADLTQGLATLPK
jgi:cystathionine beta-lyase